MNEHQKFFFIIIVERNQYTQLFKFKATEVNLLSCLICLLDKMMDLADRLSIKPPGKGELHVTYNYSKLKCIIV